MGSDAHDVPAREQAPGDVDAKLVTVDEGGEPLIGHPRAADEPAHPRFSDGSDELIGRKGAAALSFDGIVVGAADPTRITHTKTPEERFADL